MVTRKKPKVSASLDADNVDWIDSVSGLGKPFRGRSDVIDFCIKYAREHGLVPKVSLRQAAEAQRRLAQPRTKH